VQPFCGRVEAHILKMYLWAMESYQVDILNPKALKLLQDLADLKLIALNKTEEKDFMDVVTRIRKKSKSAPNLEEITQWVEEARDQRYGAK
jgi:hypothetical protein